MKVSLSNYSNSVRVTSYSISVSLHLGLRVSVSNIKLNTAILTCNPVVVNLFVRYADTLIVIAR